MKRALLAAAALSSGCFTCFVGETLIATPDGDRRIDSLQVGDSVYSFDVSVGRRLVAKVRAVHQAGSDALFSIGAGDALVRGVTSNHRLWDGETRTWRPVEDVGLGTLVLVNRADGHELRAIDRMESIRADSVAVYDITVDAPHSNYFADGVLVHNKSEILPELNPDVQVRALDKPVMEGDAVELIAELDDDYNSVEWVLNGVVLCEGQSVEEGLGNYISECGFNAGAPGTYHGTINVYHADSQGSVDWILEVLPLE